MPPIDEELDRLLLLTGAVLEGAVVDVKLLLVVALLLLMFAVVTKPPIVVTIGADKVDALGKVDVELLVAVVAVAVKDEMLLEGLVTRDELVKALDVGKLPDEMELVFILFIAFPIVLLELPPIVPLEFIAVPPIVFGLFSTLPPIELLFAAAAKLPTGSPPTVIAPRPVIPSVLLLNPPIVPPAFRLCK